METIMDWRNKRLIERNKEMYLFLKDNNIFDPKLDEVK